MTPAPDVTSIGRVVVALGLQGASTGLLDLGASVATRLGFELATVVIENANLTVLAELPFAVEIDRASANPRPLDRSRQAREMRAIQRIVGRRLRDFERAGQLRTSLTLMQGEPWPTALAAAAAADVLVVGRGTTLAWLTGARDLGSVTVIYESPARDDPALVLAALIAQTLSARLELVMPGGVGGSDDDLIQAANRLLGDRQTQVVSRAKPVVDLTAAFARVAAEHAPLLVVSRGLQATASDAMRAYLERAGRVLIIAP